MNRLGVLILFGFSVAAPSQEFDPDVIDDSSLIPLRRAKFVKLEQPVTITVKGSDALMKVYELIEKDCGEHESGSILSLAWCRITLPQPKEITLRPGKTHFELVKEVSKILQCQVIEFEWGCVIAPLQLDPETVRAKIDASKDQKVETLRSPIL